MHAQPGDRLVVGSPVTGVTRQDGGIVGLHHDDGTPPYGVRWSDTNEITLVFPGPAARVQHMSGEAPAKGPPAGAPAAAPVVPDGPTALPADHDVADDDVFFRTAPGSATAGAVGSDAAFEVDQVDEATNRGWSVLAVGRAGPVGDPEMMLRRLQERAHSEPWAGGARPPWARVALTRLAGRRITPADR
ncbi:DUF1918 domain-containing protein [Streptomyces anandii]|uniref:DUF1918 domain-containing protein n=1 Tax=Streptomyces anandii TaxID=285454 RepID=UPI0036AB03BD